MNLIPPTKSEPNDFIFIYNLINSPHANPILEEQIGQSSSKPSGKNPEVQSLQKEIQEIRNTVVEHLVTIKEGLREIRQVAPSSSCTYDQSILAELLKLISLKNKEELEHFCLWSAQDQNAKVVKNYLRAVGGTTVGKVTRSILAKLFGRQFAVQVNYNGANGKASFPSFPIHMVVIDSVRRNFDCKVSEKEINQEIINWFRNAKDRNGGRQHINKVIYPKMREPCYIQMLMRLDQ
ncbi:unnamed protein product [Allacma fusca]|uniref:DUF4806 domain-containing protein n=1 Tax=Allacma fusca TaxID=39272 RepID=A0A8J2K486_9HEXA|nr:unnamed protein product [Allacma fusca]